MTKLLPAQWNLTNKLTRTSVSQSKRSITTHDNSEHATHTHASPSRVTATHLSTHTQQNTRHHHAGHHSTKRRLFVHAANTKRLKQSCNYLIPTARMALPAASVPHPRHVQGGQAALFLHLFSPCQGSPQRPPPPAGQHAPPPACSSAMRPVNNNTKSQSLSVRKSRPPNTDFRHEMEGGRRGRVAEGGWEGEGRRRSLVVGLLHRTDLRSFETN